MTYSSAVFASPDQSLADAQRNKYAVMAERAGLRGGEHVLEIGTRLGRLRAVRRRRARLPRDDDHDLAGPARLATERVRGGRARRPRRASSCATTASIEGTYDAIVSIEMLEAVGAEYFATFFEACDRALRAGRPDEPPGDHLPGRRLRAAAARRELDPDLHLPGRPAAVAGGDRALAPRHQPARPARRRHRRRTTSGRCRPGEPRFLAQLDAVRAMGFDERFIRMWDYYLAISEAGFATGLTQDLQIVLEKGRGLA